MCRNILSFKSLTHPVVSLPPTCDANSRQKDIDGSSPWGRHWESRKDLALGLSQQCTTYCDQRQNHSQDWRVRQSLLSVGKPSFDANPSNPSLLPSLRVPVSRSPKRNASTHYGVILVLYIEVDASGFGERRGSRIEGGKFHRRDRNVRSGMPEDLGEGVLVAEKQTQHR